MPGTTSATVGVAAAGWRVDNTGNVPATASVSVPGELASSFSNGQAIAAGASVAFTLTALVAGIRSVALTSSTPGAVMSGSPQSFTGVSAPTPGPTPPPGPAPAGAPVISAHPFGFFAWSGSGGSLTAAFTGSAPFTKQWLRNGVPFGAEETDGFKSSELSLSGLQPADNGAVFSLRVTNSAGTSTSQGAVVNVAVPSTPQGVFMTRRQLNVFRLIQIEGSFTSSRYERDDRTIRWTQSGIRPLAIRGYDMGSGGAEIPLTANDYTLTIDGVPVQTVARVGATVTFSVNMDAVAEGWHWVDVIPGAGHAGETCYITPVYRRVGAMAAPQALMPIRTHTQELAFPSSGPHGDNYWGNLMPANERGSTLFYGMVPARFRPTISPLRPRAHPAFANTANYFTDFVSENLVPCRTNDIHRPTVFADGLMTTQGVQNYHYADWNEKYPLWQLHDGPRGMGNIGGAMHLQMGRNGKVYGLEPWRLFRVEEDGSVLTLCGYRHPHTGAHNYLEATENFELVGDWSAIPPERHGMRAAWGFCWDSRTLQENPAAPVPPGETEHPHLTGAWFNGPVAFVADTHNNRVLRLEWDGSNRYVPVKVTEFLTGLGDPWDIAFHDGLIYVTERTSHRVAAYDAVTGALDRVVVSGADIAFVDGNRRTALRPGQTLQTARAQPVVAPEGIFIRGDLLYVGSMVQQQIRVIDLATDAIVRTQDLVVDGNSYYVKFTVGDGTFGPPGVIFVVTWSPIPFSMPRAYLENGTEWEVNSGSTPPWHRLFADGGYPTAVAVGQGRMVVSTINEGLIKISLRLGTDAPRPANAPAGALKYWQAGYRYLHGINGWGYYGLPQPWGVDPDIDAHLTFCDHINPLTP